jgi:hypothetical protein
MMNARNTLGLGDGYSLLGSAIGLLFAMLAIGLLAHDARSQDPSALDPCDLSAVVCESGTGSR